jgi:hypothetical protein
VTDTFRTTKSGGYGSRLKAGTTTKGVAAAITKMAGLKERKASEPNPFVVGQDTVQRFLSVLGECALATKASIGVDTPGK